MSWRDAMATISPPLTGTVSRVAGFELEIRGLRVRVGDRVRVSAQDGLTQAEIVGVGDAGAVAMALGELNGVGRGDQVELVRDAAGVPVSHALIGRVVDAEGVPIDGGPPIHGETVALDGSSPSPLTRRRIETPLATGVRLIDTLCTVGQGQRVGIFGGSGMGKSTLLGMVARGTAADVTVLALVGERGREVREFVEDDLGPEGMERAVVVVSTSDQPPLLRLRAALLATRIAEWFADEGRQVMLLMDSLTRVAMAQREAGLAAGEPPTARGYTPSVFSFLPRLVERAGPRAAGAVTAFYTVLVEGDLDDDPIADAARSLLDGHLVLDRRLVEAGRFPAIDPLASLSRLADKVSPEAARLDRTAVRAALSAVEDVRDLVELGAYAAGSNLVADRGRAAEAELTSFLRQGAHERTDLSDAVETLGGLVTRWGLR